MKRILVATDFSTRSDRALRRAVLLAQRYQAELVAAHVVNADQPARKLKSERRDAEELLGKLSLSASKDNVSCSVHITQGKAHEGVLQSARETQVDLIVIGPHRRRLLQDNFIDTTAERILRNSEIPTLVANAPSFTHYNKVMFATDLTLASAGIYRQFQLLGAPYLTAAEVVYAFPPPPSRKCDAPC